MSSRRTAALAFLLLGLLPALPAAAATGGVPLTGRVVDEEGQPLAGARVELRPLAAPYDAARAELAGTTGAAGAAPVAAAASGDDGRFRLAAPAAGFWRLAVHLDGHLAAEVDAGPLETEEVIEDVALAPAVELAVRVVDGAGRPVAGAVVAGAGEPRGPRRLGTAADWRPSPRAIALTGGDGRAVLPRRAGAALEVAAAAPGFAPAAVEEVAADDEEVTLRLAAGAALAVEVRGAGGRPVAGAVVRHGRLRLPLGTTGDDGRLALRRDPAAALELEALAADGRRGGQEVPAASGDGPDSAAAPRPVTIELPAPALLAGVTLGGEERRPVPGAWVWRPGEAHLAVRSDGRGGFSLPLPRPEPATVQADAAGWVWTRAPLRDEQAAGGEPVTLLLAPAAGAAGRVVDVEGEPVAGAEVWAEMRERGGFSFQGTPRRAGALSGDDGRFRLPELGAGHAVTLHARRDGHAPGELDLGAVEPGTMRDGLEIVLPPGITAFGRVVDVAEDPVAGAEVALQPTMTSGDPFAMRRLVMAGHEPATATTDREGRFEIADLAAGRVDVRASAPGFAPLAVPGVELAAGARADLGTLLLEPGQTLAGRVVDPAGRPVADAEVRVDRESTGPGDRFLGRGGGDGGVATDADGRFVVADLARGERVEVNVKRSGYSPARLPGVEVPAEEPLTVVLQPASTLSGLVLDADGDPVAGARVLVQGEPRPGEGFSRQASQAATADDGRFTLEDVPPGRAVASVRAAGFLVHEESGLEVEQGRDRDDLRFVLQPGATLTGRVADAAGRPLSAATVELLVERRPLSLGFGGRVAATTDADGVYVLEGVPPGEQSFAAGHESHVRAVRDLAVTAGDNRLDFRLERGLSVTGRVLDEGGAPLAGVRVALDARGGRQVRSGTGELTGDDGAFELDGVEPGTYTVSAQKEGFAATHRDGVEVAGAPVAGLELRLARGAVVTGRLLGLELAELASARVVAVQPGGSGFPVFAAVAHDGSFRLEGLGPGTWTLMATLGSGTLAAQEELTIEPGQSEMTVDLDLGRPGSVLRGRVLLGDTPLVDAYVILTGRQGTAAGFDRTDHQGRFELHHLDGGTYELQVGTMGGVRQETRTVEIDGDQEIEVRIAASTVRGVVLGGGEPLEGAAVSLEPQDGEPGFQVPVRSDAAGRFVLAAVPAGRYRLRAEATGFASGEAAVVVEEGVPVDGLEVRLERTAGLVLVVAGPFGRPPETVSVAALDPASLVAAAPGAAAGSGPRTVYRDRLPAGEGGRVRLDGLPAGRWRLVVGAEGLAAVQVDAVSPGPELAVALPPQARLSVEVPELAGSGELGEVRVTGGDGRPFVLPDWLSARAAFPLRGGRTEVRGLPPGRWTVTAATPDGRTWSAAAVTAAGAAPEVVLE